MSSTELMSTECDASNRGAAADRTAAIAAHQRLPLFRAEAVAAQVDLGLGRPIGLVPVSWTVLTALLAALLGIAAIFLTGATYARKETAQGILRPAAGDVRVSAHGSGFVRKLFVSEGTVVVRGAPLAIISTERTLESGAIADDRMLAALAREEQMLRARLAALDAASAYEESVLTAQIAALVAEREAARALRGSSAARLRIAEERFELGRKLNVQSFIAHDEMRRREEAVIEQRQAGIDAQSREAALAARIAELEARRAQHPHMTLQERGAIEVDLATLQLRRAQLEAQKSYALHAQIAGRVSALQASVGQPVDAQRPLMTITAADMPLRAELYVSSRAIGFVRPGQRVRLLYDAFPYERFGPGYGVVEAVSANVLMPADVQAAVPITEPVYRVLAQLDRDYVDAYGQRALLRPGMALSADIVLERRSLAHWLLGPLLAMRGQL